MDGRKQDTVFQKPEDLDGKGVRYCELDTENDFVEQNVVEPSSPYITASDGIEKWKHWWKILYLPKVLLLFNPFFKNFLSPTFDSGAWDLPTVVKNLSEDLIPHHVYYFIW